MVVDHTIYTYDVYLVVTVVPLGMSVDKTTIKVDTAVRDQLADLKPYDSISFNDLLQEMADTYESADTGGGSRG